MMFGVHLFGLPKVSQACLELVAGGGGIELVYCGMEKTSTG
jgi:hypothetical protein